jgi:dipeptidyl aminopeptidase/acylaminoacyl peptidase
MARWPAVLLLVALLGCSTANAESLPGQMLLSGSRIDLYTPATGEVRAVAERGSDGVLLRSGRELAYVREVGCFPTGKNSCFSEYSVFDKSVDEEAAAPGRETFGPTDWFVRGIDVSPSGRLVFSAKPGVGPTGGWEHEMEIYSANLDGSGIRQLTHNRAFDNDPAVSPDGRRVAFSRRVDGRGQIFTMRLDGSHAVRVTHDNDRDRLPVWSPDGRRLLYLSQPAGHGGFAGRELFAVPAAGGKGRRLTHNKISEEAAAYSPDGRWIAFLGAGAVWAMGAGGSSPHKILSPGIVAGYSGIDWGPLP